MSKVILSRCARSFAVFTQLVLLILLMPSSASLASPGQLPQLEHFAPAVALAQVAQLEHFAPADAQAKVAEASEPAVASEWQVADSKEPAADAQQQLPDLEGPAIEDAQSEAADSTEATTPSQWQVADSIAPDPEIEQQQIEQPAEAVAAVAQQQDIEYEEPTPRFSVSSFIVEGPNPLSQKRTDAILAAFLNREMDIEELREAATALETELATEGYNFYRAELPPQTLKDGVVRLEVQRINIGGVTVVGNQFFSADNIRRSLPLISVGKSPNTRQIANAMLLAEDNPAKDVRVIFLKGQEPQTVDANISVQDQNPNDFSLWANNSGNRQTEDSRIGFQYNNRNLWGRDHQMSLSFTTSPQEPSELQQFGINYRAPIFSFRGMVNAFFSKSDAETGRVADVFDVSGAGETIGFGYTHYLDKLGDYQHRLGFDLIDKMFDSDVLFDTENIGEDVRSRPLSIEYIARLDGTQWLFNGTVSHSTNLSGGSFNDDASYQAVRAGASNDWDKQNIALRLDYRMGRDWTTGVKLFAQLASDPLIPGEKFGFGGALGDPGPRGFYEREVTVDEGIKGTLEVTRNFPTRRIRAGAFFDFASGDSNNPQVGESPDESLSSIGISVDWNIRTDVSLNLDYGYILNGIDQTFAPEASDDGDSRLHLSLRWYPNWPWGNK